MAATMQDAITEFAPTRFVFSVRFVQGYRFLDRCGEAIVRLESVLDPGWIPGEIAPTGGVMRNYTLGMESRFNSESFTLIQEEFLSVEHFIDQTCKTYDALYGTFDVARILSPSFRSIYQVGFRSPEDADSFLYGLQLCSLSKKLQAHMGAGTPILNLVLCMTDHIEWSGSKEPRRRRFEAKAIRQERQPRFDERLMRRLSLLPERHKQAVQDLRKLRRQHSQIVENAVQFDLEETLEAEANSKTFPLSTFLKGAYEWTKTVDRLMNA